MGSRLSPCEKADNESARIPQVIEISLFMVWILDGRIHKFMRSLEGATSVDMKKRVQLGVQLGYRALDKDLGIPLILKEY